MPTLLIIIFAAGAGAGAVLGVIFGIESTKEEHVPLEPIESHVGQQTHPGVMEALDKAFSAQSDVEEAHRRGDRPAGLLAQGKLRAQLENMRMFLTGDPG